jgi:hypothetical protein
MVNRVEEGEIGDAKSIESYQPPEFDCKRRIGKDKYTFYFPIEISNFCVQLWTRDSKAGDGYSEWTRHTHDVKLPPGTRDNVK